MTSHICLKKWSLKILLFLDVRIEISTTTHCASGESKLVELTGEKRNTNENIIPKSSHSSTHAEY